MHLIRLTDREIGGYSWRGLNSTDETWMGCWEYKRKAGNIKIWCALKNRITDWYDW